METEQESTDLLEKLHTEGYTIIGDYHYHFFSDKLQYAFAKEDDNEILKLKAGLSLRERLIFNLRLNLDTGNGITKSERPELENALSVLKELVKEVVVVEPGITPYEGATYATLGDSYGDYRPIIFFSLVDTKSRYLVDGSNETFIEWNQKRKAAVTDIEADRDPDAALLRNIAELKQSMIDGIDKEQSSDERQQAMSNVVTSCFSLRSIKVLVELNLFVKMDFIGWMHLMGRLTPDPSTQKKSRHKKKKGFTSPGETLEGNYRVSIHAYSQIINYKGAPNSTAEQIEKWEQQTGLTIGNEIPRYGLDLTITQQRVMDGIMSAMSETQYKGNMPSKPVKEVLKDLNIRYRTKEEVPNIYKNLSQLSQIQITQRDLLRLCGVNEENKSEMIEALEALNYLGKTQFCFYYTRMVVNEHGEPVKDPKTGDIKKEEVQAVDKLFLVKAVRDEDTQAFKYYEIMPSPIFLDQVEKHFLLIPRGWMDEVRNKVGVKRASSYTFKFLIYLRLRFEKMRRQEKKSRVKGEVKKANGNYEIKIDWRELAKDLKMPESVCVRNRKRALGLLEDACIAAFQLGYLTSHIWENDFIGLVLDAKKYHVPVKDIQCVEA